MYDENVRYIVWKLAKIQNDSISNFGIEGLQEHDSQWLYHMSVDGAFRVAIFQLLRRLTSLGHNCLGGFAHTMSFKLGG